ncbi:MAG TPA: glycosyltransferase family 2 protein [Cyclobacteriaceae bacterium]|nr:glycosyltransferase family 2 protein [Cyclobacteriaceae bacterium]
MQNYKGFPLVFVVRKKVTVVVPVYDEAPNVSVLAKKINAEFEHSEYDHELIFVDDGSTDDTLVRLTELSECDKNVFFISFSRNFGQQNAIKAGLDHATGDCVITMDGDLQHPPSMIKEFLKHWEDGYDVVYTLREPDKTTSWFKRTSSKLFYKVMSLISDVPIEDGSADFRLLDRVVVDQLKRLPEIGPFYRGLVKWVGFNQKAISYKAAPRHSGRTKYSLNKMIQLAVEGATSFNIRPLVFSISLGFFFSVFSLVAYLPYMIYMLSSRNHFPRWASLISLVVFFGGLNLIVLGFIGIYIGKLFLQAKSRPHYIVQKSNLCQTSVPSY